MKSLNFIPIATGLVACAMFLGSCKDEQIVGPAGPAGSNGYVPVSTDGFIRGNVSGTRQDGTPFNETFDYKNYWGTPSATLDSTSPGNCNFVMARGTDVFGNNSAGLTVNTVAKNSSTGTISMDYFMFSKSLGANQLFTFELTGQASSAITGLQYNMSTGLFTGNFSFTLTGLQNSTGNAATISGNFEATVTQLYHLQQHSTEYN